MSKGKKSLILITALLLATAERLVLLWQQTSDRQPTTIWLSRFGTYRSPTAVSPALGEASLF